MTKMAFKEQELWRSTAASLLLFSTNIQTKFRSVKGQMKEGLKGDPQN
jgi:hypothetical protein